jgi:hypothetical protein
MKITRIQSSCRALGRQLPSRAARPGYRFERTITKSELISGWMREPQLPPVLRERGGRHFLPSAGRFTLPIGPCGVASTTSPRNDINRLWQKSVLSALRSHITVSAARKQTSTTEKPGSATSPFQARLLILARHSHTCLLAHAPCAVN